MTNPVTCLRCGNVFLSAIDEAQLEDKENSVISVKCPKWGKLNPTTQFL